jgi:hypothetical protein
VPRIHPTRSRYEAVLMNKAAEDLVRFNCVGSGSSIRSGTSPKVPGAC